MIFLDNASTTKPYESVIEKAFLYSINNFYNPCALYTPAYNVKKQIDGARQTILKQLNAEDYYDIVF